KLSSRSVSRPMEMMESLEQRQLLSAAMPLAAAKPPAQNLYQDPYIVRSYNGHRLAKNAYVSFGKIAQGTAAVTKTISLLATQGNFSTLLDSDTSTPGVQATVITPANSNFSASVAISKDDIHATLSITFNPVTPGITKGTVVVKIYDGSNTVIAVNVAANVLPPPTVQITRIDMARLPDVVGGDGSKGVAHVQLTNDGALAVRGAATVQLYASSSSTFDAANSTLLGTTNTFRTFQAGDTKQISVDIKYPLPSESGDFYIFAIANGTNVIAPGGGEYLSPIQQPIQRPFINLSGVPTQSDNFAVGKHTPISVPISNTGNIKVHAKVSFQLYAVPPSGSGSDTPIVIGSYTRSYSIRPNDQAIRKVSLGQAVPAGWEIVAQIVAVKLPANFSAEKQIDYIDTFAVR
ncbi:MAG TPA: hypothetical protein VG722_07845, partial [Tepidisphaeraceae bacterium]|nr:hypothetical protein [Tepidisphaeraceae bacterium]